MLFVADGVSRLRLLWWLLALMAGVLSCGPVGDVAGLECLRKTDCAATLDCINNLCVASQAPATAPPTTPPPSTPPVTPDAGATASCATNADCPADRQCVNAACVPYPAGSCDANRPCPSGQQCKTNRCEATTLEKDAPCDVSNDRCGDCLHCCPVLHVCVADWWNSSC